MSWNATRNLEPMKTGIFTTNTTPPTLNQWATPTGTTMTNFFIIDQINPNTGEFDEHKLVKGANLDMMDAALVYLSNYEPNWQGLGAISEATPHVFDLWLHYGNRKEPFSNSRFAEKSIDLSSAMVGDAAPDASRTRHWITARGSHILINGNGEVIGGAGGKLAGKKFSVPSGSKDVSKHIETVEKIAQAGYEKHGGDKADYLRMGRNKGSSSHFAREYEKTGDIPEGHLRDAVSGRSEQSGLSQEYLDSKIVPIAEDEHGRSLSKGKRGFIASNAYGNVNSFDTEAKAVKWINKESKGSGLPDFDIGNNRKFDAVIPEEGYEHYGVDVSKSLINKSEKKSEEAAKTERAMSERDRRAYYSNMSERDRDAAVRNLFDDALMDKPFVPTHVDSATGKPLQEIQEYMKDSNDEMWLVKGHKDEDGNFYRGNSFDNEFVHPVSKKDYEQIKSSIPNAAPTEQAPNQPNESSNDLTTKQNNATLSSTSQVEADNKNEGSIMDTDKLKALYAERKDYYKEQAYYKAKDALIESGLSSYDDFEKMEEDWREDARAKEPVVNHGEVASKKTLSELVVSLNTKNSYHDSQTVADVKRLKDNTVNTQYPDIRRSILKIEGAGEYRDENRNKVIFVPEKRLNDVKKHIKKWEAEQPKTLTGNTYAVKEELKKQFGAQWNGQSWQVKAKDVEAAQKLIDGAKATSSKTESKQSKSHTDGFFYNDKKSEDYNAEHETEYEKIRELDDQKESFDNQSANLAQQMRSVDDADKYAALQSQFIELSKKSSDISNKRLSLLSKLTRHEDLNSYSAKELLEKEKDYDNVQNEGTQEGYNPYRNERQNRENANWSPTSSAKMNEGVEYDAWGEPINMRGN